MPPTSYEHAYQAIADVLVEQGVEKLFTLMSDGTIGLVTTFAEEYDDEFEMIYTRHESGAVGMADGYARGTGEIGVCAVGRGPALTNTATSLLTARKKGSNVLLIAPKRPLFRYYDNPAKRFDQNSFLQTTVGGSDSDRNRYGHSDRVVDIDSHETLIGDFEEVFRRLRASEGPIVVQIPNDVLNEPETIARPAGGREANAFEDASPGVLTPAAEDVEKAVAVYLDSDPDRPSVIIAGEGAVQANAKDEILSFAERTNALLTTTMQSRGLFHDHPYALGTVGGFGTHLANEYVRESDFILTVGCSLNRFTTDKGRLFGEEEERSTIVHIDTDLNALDRYTPVDVAVHGDARATLEATNRKLAAASVDRGDAFWNDDMRRRIKNAKPYMNPEAFKDGGDRIDPRRVVTFLNEVIPDDRIVLHDTGQHQFWVLDGMEITDPGDFIWTKDFGAVGEALKMGIGAALDDSRTCVTLCGDGGFMMSMQELETAVRHEIPVIVVVLNNRALGAEYYRVLRNDLPTDGSQIETPDLGDVAESLGADGYTIKGLEDLRPLADELSGRPSGPIVLNCEIVRDMGTPRAPSG